jgi:hypothetical protein
MLRETDVPTMMTRVETALARAARAPEPPAWPIFVHTEGDDDLGIANLRDPGNIRIEFPSGSDRPVVGPAIRFTKRAVRRSLRWYVAPIMEQQSRFNQALLDLIEKLRLQNENLRNELESLREEKRAD